MASNPSVDIAQQQRFLLGGGSAYDDEEKHSSHDVEWHLRTGWAITGSLFAMVAIFWLLIIYTKTYITVAVEVPFNALDALSSDFRRPSSDYVLDRHWNFNAPPQVRNYNWTILDRIANPDGVYRPMIMINGQFPGPLIECNEGDTLVIDVYNQGVNATSMHFHGIYQNGTNWMDGTNGVTQCPIAPSQHFQYRFTVTGQSGTYFYHGHQAVQIADGLYGPLVVHSRNERDTQIVRYVSDRVVMVQDYYHDLSSGLLKARLEPGGESDPIPDGALINGLNVYDCASSPNRLCHNATATLPVFDLAPNQSHRLRVINVGAFAWFEISLDEHSMAITEADGTATEPMETSQLHISPGQRYSVIVDADHQEATSFWLRAKMITNCFSDPSLPPNGANEARAIVRYSKESEPRPFSPLVSQPTSRRDNIAQAVICRDMESKGLVPVPSIPAPATADHTYHLRTNMEIGNWRLQRGVFNHSSFRPNLKSPSLHRVVGGLRVENTTLHLDSDGLNSAAFESKHELVIQHSGIKVVDLIIQNMDEGSHPMHLHGHKFWVLGQGHAYFPGYDKLQTELSNPLRRDTAAVEGFGWMLIRFVTDNPGMWTFHCHMAWHGEAGLAMQFLSQPEVMATWDVPDANLRLCEADGLEKGAAPKDEIWYGHGS